MYFITFLAETSTAKQANTAKASTSSYFIWRKISQFQNKIWMHENKFKKQIKMMKREENLSGSYRYEMDTRWPDAALSNFRQDFSWKEREIKISTNKQRKHFIRSF